MALWFVCYTLSSYSYISHPVLHETMARSNEKPLSPSNTVFTLTINFKFNQGGFKCTMLLLLVLELPELM